MSTSELLGQLQERFGDTLLDAGVNFGEVTIEVAPQDLVVTATALRDEAAFRFEQLIDVCGVDYLAYGETEWATDETTTTGFSRAVDARGSGRLTAVGEELSTETPQKDRRFAAVYHLLSVRHNRRLRIKVFGPDDQLPVIPSLIEVWSSANWFEREAFDLFGIMFAGHPDLRRILTDYGFIGHPFRKDFPLIGEVEMRYDPEQGRVIYEPVGIEPRTLVPRVIRDDLRYEEGWKPEQPEAEETE